MTSHAVISPGATIGVLGSGQLGRMFALAARAMGYRIHVLSPDPDAPTAQVADMEVIASYDDLEAVRRFGSGVDVVTFEFENVPAETTNALQDIVPVRPDGAILHVTQNRLREKRWLQSQGCPVTPFTEATSASDLITALAPLGGEAICKTAGWGYDGKGQVRVTPGMSSDDIWAALGSSPVICEAIVPFEREVSVVIARGLDGDMQDYGLFENHHEHHILDLTLAPACVAVSITDEARQLARQIASALELVGVLCVEMFLTPDGGLLVNELAPRPHNSGHLTIEACQTSQFAQQVRAICGLPLGDPGFHAPAAMANLLGDRWEGGAPRWEAALRDPRVSLHLYGKTEARAGRKMGHLTALGESVEDARSRVLAARDRL
ncbi:MAG: N5-carboxyaminoimidazole ribonucleotide synthase [bacterium]|nr:N5-carboxyaminoimidazole ribonucleotide synthase [bacterium]